MNQLNTKANFENKLSNFNKKSGHILNINLIFCLVFIPLSILLTYVITEILEFHNMYILFFYTVLASVEGVLFIIWLLLLIVINIKMNVYLKLFFLLILVGGIISCIAFILMVLTGYL